MKPGLLLTLGLGAMIASSAAGCGGGGGASSGRTTTPGGGGTTVVTGPRTQGTGQAVSETANSRFLEAARMMRQHDEANEGRGDWNNGVCNDVAGRFESAANEQQGGAFAEAWFNRGLAFERCNMTNEARQAMQRANQVSTHGYCRARAQLGVYQYRANQREEARTTFEGAIHDDQNCVEAYTNLAMLQRERLATDTRFTSLMAQPASPERDRQLDEMFRDIIGNIRQALARDDRFIPALNQLALAYLLRAGDDPRSQRLMLAGIVCSQAVQVTTQHRDEIAADVRGFIADVYNTWGLIDIRSGQIIRALEHFRRAYQLNATMFEAWMNYGTINLSFRGYGDAREAFQHAVQLRDTDYDAHIGLGIALRGLNQLDQAQAEYERARTIDANRADAYYNLGVLSDSYREGEIPQLRHAIELLNQFISHAGGAPRYADAVARARIHIRNAEQAITALNAVSQLNAQGGGGGSTAAPAGSSAPPASGGSTAPPAGGATPAGGAPAGGGAH